MKSELALPMPPLLATTTPGRSASNCAKDAYWRVSMVLRSTRLADTKVSTSRSGLRLAVTMTSSNESTAGAAEPTEGASVAVNTPMNEQAASRARSECVMQCLPEDALPRLDNVATGKRGVGETSGPRSGPTRSCLPTAARDVVEAGLRTHGFGLRSKRRHRSPSRNPALRWIAVAG